ncbi:MULTISPECIES: hypothetical protein [Pseudonocardia]|uniref:Secreted protein n=2 Tax=Pseudonocardia TaxID=1847 RepID=A0A1Y2N749_PSEAH|nr:MULTISPECIES: hypothetical protein [Pseudonocardia]OSY42917.1 hypothetical protein BG845_01159 [Pseudonocardia autotrophica]TDN77494.1 hypothetical protein C8E95_6741 [Pseudonocardia autotrophica]BBG01517.1 hypothetical protein Pdca_27260 [Pseudonocardia autotrophica]GEC25301.1 hypothetical protein PSA01_23300 [Pseudonocardia saturnea]
MKKWMRNSLITMGAAGVVAFPLAGIASADEGDLLDDTLGDVVDVVAPSDDSDRGGLPAVLELSDTVGEAGFMG